MTTEQIALVVLAAVALVALLVAVLAVVVARRALARSEALLESLDAALAAPPTPPPAEVPEDAETWVITDAGDDLVADSHPGVPARIDGRLFVDIVARESLVKAVSWGHGLRRALAPDVRNRIRFEMRQQTRRSRKDRKVEMREALREYRARRTVPEAADATEDAA